MPDGTLSSLVDLEINRDRMLFWGFTASGLGGIFSFQMNVKLMVTS